MEIRELLIIVGITEALLHYFPWRRLLGVDLPRLAAYTLGLLGMMVPFSVWLIDHGMMDEVHVLWMVIAAAGGTVFALYGFDRYLELEIHHVESEQLEKLMAEKLKDKNHGKDN